MSTDNSNPYADSPFCDLPEREIIELAKVNPDAMSCLYRVHYPAIFRYVRRRITHAHDVNDIVAEVFISMVNSLSKYKWTGIPFRYWLFRIATNQIHRRIRSSKRTWFWIPLGDEHVGHANAPSPDIQDRHDIVASALQQLPVHLQSVIALYYFEDMSVEAISQVMNCRSGTVKSRLFRARELLRKHISFDEETTIHEQRTVGILPTPVE